MLSLKGKMTGHSKEEGSDVRCSHSYWRIH